MCLSWLEALGVFAGERATEVVRPVRLCRACAVRLCWANLTFKGAAEAKSMLRKLIPRPAKRAARHMHRAVAFARAARLLARDPMAVAENDSDLTALIYGWGNEGYSAELEYLRQVIRSAWSTQGDMLECGSGLSTVALAAVASHRGTRVISLEHMPGWANRVRSTLERRGLAGQANIHVTPLTSYGGYEWYRDPPRDRRFSLVVCDGPPGTTKGGRIGLWDQMHAQLTSGATILLDDLDRPEEQTILDLWTTQSGGESATYGSGRPFGVLRLP
jgi:hypothetical protein